MHKVIFDLDPEEYLKLEKRIKKMKIAKMSYQDGKYLVTIEDYNSIGKMLVLVKELKYR